MSMNRRENLLALLNHEPHDHVPNFGMDCAWAGCDKETFENGSADNPYDGFGVKWESTASALGAGTPDGSHIVLDDVCDWEDKVTFPDLDAYDWAAAAEEQLAGFDPVNQILEYACYNGPFLRLMHLMGFQEGLLSMLEEPEATEALLTAITDYRIRSLDYIQEYFHPDTVMMLDDFATKLNMFISVDTYDELIKPQHTRFFAAVKERGMIPNMHVCGKPELVVPGFVDEGIAAWEICQPENDLVGLAEQVGDRLAFIGGFDMQGPLITQGCTEEELRQNVRDTIDAYAPAGNYGFLGMAMVTDLDKLMWYGGIIGDEAARYGENYYIR